MLIKGIAEWVRHSLVKQNAHSRRRKRGASGVVQHITDLVFSSARVPGQKLAHRCAILEVLEERRYWYSGSAKHPGATHAIRVALDGVAG